MLFACLCKMLPLCVTVGINQDNVKAYHTVVHDFVPVFTSHNAEQQHDGIRGCLKVGMSGVKEKVQDRYENRVLDLW